MSEDGSQLRQRQYSSLISASATCQTDKTPEIKKPSASASALFDASSALVSPSEQVDDRTVYIDRVPEDVLSVRDPHAALADLLRAACPNVHILWISFPRYTLATWTTKLCCVRQQNSVIWQLIQSNFLRIFCFMRFRISSCLDWISFNRVLARCTHFRFKTTNDMKGFVFVELASSAECDSLIAVWTPELILDCMIANQLSNVSSDLWGGSSFLCVGSEWSIWAGDQVSENEQRPRTSGAASASPRRATCKWLGRLAPTSRQENKARCRVNSFSFAYAYGRSAYGHHPHMKFTNLLYEYTRRVLRFRRCLPRRPRRKCRKRHSSEWCSWVASAAHCS